MNKNIQPCWMMMCIVLILPACAATPTAYSIQEDKNLDLVEHAMPL
ncbi:MAG: hypothetical protein Q9M18_07470 [Mariprofundaceae bacterium]|nr:hypothetical protein [Mariprofundaceae bacterium]